MAFLLRILIIGFTVSIFCGNEKAVAQRGHHHHDSTENHIIVKKITPFFNSEFSEIDSSFSLFHIYRPSQKQSISNSQLGNIGLPTMSNIYHDRLLNYDVDFMFNVPFDLYLIEPNEVLFYNTRRPYTNIKHTSGTKAQDEQTIAFTHSQNVNPRLNVTADYNLISSLGQYPSQSTRNRSMNLNSNYQTERYSAFIALNLNKFEVQNNGGIIDTGFVDMNAPETYLSDASTELTNNHLFLLQEYRIGNTKTEIKNDSMVQVLEPRIKFTHYATINRQHRIYKDKQSFENGFYTNFYIQKDQSMDSVFLSSVQNVVAVHSEPLFTNEKKFGFNLLLSNKRNSYYNFKEYIFLRNINTFWDTKLAARIYRNQKESIIYDISGEYYFTGYRFGDHKLKAKFANVFSDSTGSNLKLELEYSSAEPDYFLNTFYSNHFRWENEFEPEKNARARISFEIPHNHFKLQATASAVQNYTFFSTVALPMQFKEWLYVYSATAKKNFHLGRIRFFNEVTAQHSSNQDIINLPLIAAYHSTSIQLRVPHALIMYIGFDIQYSTKYKAYSYMPGHGMFYFENKYETGNYPIASAYINGKIKDDVLFFVKFSHINSNILRDNYFSVRSYPINNRLFKWGVQWTFNN